MGHTGGPTDTRMHLFFVQIVTGTILIFATARATVSSLMSLVTTLLGLCLVAIGEVDFASGDVQTALNMVTQQLDYIANSNTPPRVSGKDQERLSWSIQPSSSTTIDKVGKWYDVADTRVNFSLQRTGLVVIHYNLVARASKPQHPGGDFLNGGGNRMSSNSDFLAGRLKVDAIPYRQSGSHVSPLSSLESSSRQLSGSLIIELGKGNHTVHLQWRKWGHVVTNGPHPLTSMGMMDLQTVVRLR